MSSALGIGVWLAYQEARRQEVDPDHILNLVLWAAPAGLLGARLYFVFFHWGYYGQHLGEILATRQGGLSIHGTLIGGILAGYLYIRRQGLAFWSMADIVAPSLILGQAIGRWGNFFNQEAHGGPVSAEFMTRFPPFIREGMLINGQYYHPTFLYESVWNFLVFLLLLWLRRRKGLVAGDLFLIYLGLYSLARFFIEGLRTDSLMLGPFKAAQVVGLIVVPAVLAALWWRHRPRMTEG
jgi:phosphatidylglycerol:prolipoprotein diacylglycerol transferase